MCSSASSASLRVLASKDSLETTSLDCVMDVNPAVLRGEISEKKDCKSAPPRGTSIKSMAQGKFQQPFSRTSDKAAIWGW